jgi:hypothetical protein
LSRFDRVRPFPHEHSKSIRCSERQSSSNPRSISCSPQLHSRMMRAEQGLFINHSKDWFLAVLAGVCVLIAVGGWIHDTSTESFVEYAGTLVATFAGVVIATYFSVWQFYSQARANDEERSEQLAQSQAGELFTVLDIFGGIPIHYLPNSAGGSTPIPVILAQLESTATEEAMRVGLLGTQSSANLS